MHMSLYNTHLAIHFEESVSSLPLLYFNMVERLANGHD